LGIRRERWRVRWQADRHAGV